MKHWFLLLLFLAPGAQAKVEVLFHPHDPTLEKIANWISDARSTVDIAMYNMETSEQSPVIQELKTNQVQRRIQSGELKIRLLFEGYSSPKDNEKKMAELESIGVDVRYLGKAMKVHHKFAVIDAGLESHRVITGSANWSLSSYRNYNENILFFAEESEITGRYHTEFSRLWQSAKAFGLEVPEIPEMREPMTYRDQKDFEVYFNSPRTLGLDEESHLTSQVVRLIEGARFSLKIATTRVRLQPILQSLSVAAQRGVKIQLLISQDDFRDIGRRTGLLFRSPNLQLRVKFYDLNVSNYMSYQMHNKFMIVDEQVVMAGSFNWSQSSERNHIENLVEISGRKAQQILPSYLREFDFLWNMGRSEYRNLQSRLSLFHNGPCSVPPMALSVSEIRNLLRLAPHCR